MKLITFASPKFRVRRFFLDRSARNGAFVSGSRRWTLGALRRAGFTQRFPEIGLNERGNGFWAWKPFIILKAMEEGREGDLFLYCDVGRRYPWKLIDRPLDRLVRWMDDHGQDVFPGVGIPWQGPMSRWTKRDAFVLTDTDRADVHTSTPVQASFSVWRKSAFTLALAREWLSLCGDRRLVSDDPSVCGHPELPDFQEHRHDQSLLSILCHKHGLAPLDAGSVAPDFDEKSPVEIARLLGEPARALPLGFRFLLALASGVEQRLR